MVYYAWSLVWVLVWALIMDHGWCLFFFFFNCYRLRPLRRSLVACLRLMLVCCFWSGLPAIGPLELVEAGERERSRLPRCGLKKRFVVLASCLLFPCCYSYTGVPVFLCFAYFLLFVRWAFPWQGFPCCFLYAVVFPAVPILALLSMPGFPLFFNSGVRFLLSLSWGFHTAFPLLVLLPCYF